MSSEQEILWALSDVLPSQISQGQSCAPSFTLPDITVWRLILSRCWISSGPRSFPSSSGWTLTRESVLPDQHLELSELFADGCKGLRTNVVKLGGMGLENGEGVDPITNLTGKVEVEETECDGAVRMKGMWPKGLVPDSAKPSW